MGGFHWLKRVRLTTGGTRYIKPVTGDRSSGAGFDRVTCDRSLWNSMGQRNKIRGMSALEEVEGKVDRKGRSGRMTGLPSYYSW